MYVAPFSIHSSLHVRNASSARSGLSSRPDTTRPSGQFTEQQRTELGKVLRNLDQLEKALKPTRASSSAGQPATPAIPSSPPPVVTSKSISVGPDTARAIGSQATADNRVENSGFEGSAVRQGSWGLINNMAGWNNTAGSIELWNRLYNYKAADGNQWIELDVKGSSTLDSLEQTIDTVPGQIYKLSFAYSPRPGVSAASNELAYSFDGQTLDTISAEGRGLRDTQWRMRSVYVQATQAQSTIKIAETSSDGVGMLLDAISFTESSRKAADSANFVDHALNTDTYSELDGSSVRSGTVSINNQAIAIDVDNDSLQDIVNSINDADAGVLASLVRTGSSKADGSEIVKVELASTGSQLVLNDAGTGLLSALGINAGSYGEAPVNPGGTQTSSENTLSSYNRRRSYRAADALENIQQSLEALFSESPSSSSKALSSALRSIFERVEDRYGSDRLSALGLRITGADDGFLKIDKQSRRRFTHAVQQEDNKLYSALLGRYRTRNSGLIEALQVAIKEQLRQGGPASGSIINRLA